VFVLLSAIEDALRPDGEGSHVHFPYEQCFLFYGCRKIINKARRIVDSPLDARIHEYKDAP
jgi:hypothetical protein